MEDEVVVAFVQSAEVFQRDGLLVVASPFLDVCHEVRERRLQIDHQLGIAHRLGHLLEQLHVGFEVAVGEVALLLVVGGEDIDPFVDAAVLDDGVRGAGNLQQVAEPLFEEVDLQCERPSRDVLIIVFKVRVIVDSLEAGLPSVMLGEHSGERCLAAPDISSYCDVHIDCSDCCSVTVAKIQILM